MSELHFTITALSPLAVNGRKAGGSQYQEAIAYIPGRVMRGVLATDLLRTCQNKLGRNDHIHCPNPALCRALLNGDMLFRDALPVGRQATTPHLLPNTALSCKDKGGFITEGSDVIDDKHGVFDSLIDRTCCELLMPLAIQYQPSCPLCGGRTQAVAGPYSIEQNSEGIRYRKQEVARELLTHAAINRRRGVAEDELLYALSAISPYAKKPAVNCDPSQATSAQESGASAPPSQMFPSIRFAGSIWLPDDDLRDALETLLGNVRAIGSGRTRGMGSVAIHPVSPPASKSLEERLSKFNQHFVSRWQRFAGLSSSTLQPAGGYFSITLQSNAILVSADGWEPTLSLTPEQLWLACGESGLPPSSLKLLRSDCSWGVNGGWNELWGMRKRSAQVVQAGSLYLFQVEGLEGWSERLQRLEITGIGDLRAEGFGQVRVCDEFHTITGGKQV